MARGLALPTFLASLVALAGIGTSSQQLPPGYLDPQPILDAAAKAIGTDNLKCVTISGTAYGGAVGQQRESAWNVDWPRIDSLANYTRTMNWETRTMVEEFDREPGLNPASWKYGVGWIDGPLQQNRHQTFIVSGRHAWHMDGPKAPPVAVATGPRGDLRARHVAQSARLPQGRAQAGREPESDLAMGARRDGARRPRGQAGQSQRRFDHLRRQIPRRRDDQSGAHAPADPYVGGASGARRHELRARVHQRQLRRSRKRREISWRVALSPRLGRQLRRAERHRRPQCIWRSAEGHPRQPVSRHGRGPRFSGEGHVSRPRRDAEARRRRVPDWRRLAQQRRRRVQRCALPSSRRRSTRSAASP